MAATTVHRIFTEDKNKRGILRLACAQFESFTVQRTDGYIGECASNPSCGKSLARALDRSSSSRSRFGA
jgi:hypothetical protein